MANEIERMQVEIKRLEQALQQQKQSAFHLQRENHRLQKLTEEQSTDASANKQALAALEQERAELRSKLERVQTDLANLQATRTVRFSRLAGLMSRSLKQLAGDLRSGPLAGALDLHLPANITLGEGLKVSGWAVSRAGRVQAVEVWLDDTRLGSAYYGTERPDVSAARPLQATPNCGFAAEFPTHPPLVTPGSKKLKVRVTDSKGNQQIFSREITIGLPPLLVSLSHRKPFNYKEWIAINEPGEAELHQQRESTARLEYHPLFSLVMFASRIGESLFDVTLESLVKQTYDKWELCVVVGGPITQNQQELLENTASKENRFRFIMSQSDELSNKSLFEWNNALKMAQGEFVAFLEEDATLAPNALYENARLLNLNPDAAMIYSDEDNLRPTGERYKPVFKPDWSPDLFRSEWYTGHLAFYRNELIVKAGGLRSTFKVATEYDLMLRLLGHSDKIYHVPRLLYHGPVAENSRFTETASKALAEHFQRLSIRTEISAGLVEDTWRVKYLLPAENLPKVSIIIPTRDQVELLRQCVDSVQHLTAYPNFEIVIVDNNSVQPATFDYFNALRDELRVRVLSYPHEFNFAAINNFAVSQVTSQLVLFLNNDIEVTAPGWLEALVEHAIRPEVGAVGARLLYPDGTLQHGGVVIGVGGQAGHAQKHLPGSEPGYINRAKVIQNFSAVTGACLMMRTELFREVGGFEEILAVAFNDIDLCLRLRQRGFLIVWTPYAELIHHESVSRGRDEFDPVKTARFQREVQYMHRHWEHVISDDPYYNPNLTLEVEDFSVAPLSRYRE